MITDQIHYNMISRSICVTHI